MITPAEVTCQLSHPSASLSQQPRIVVDDKGEEVFVQSNQHLGVVITFVPESHKAGQRPREQRPSYLSPVTASCHRTGVSLSQVMQARLNEGGGLFVTAVLSGDDLTLPCGTTGRERRVCRRRTPGHPSRRPRSIRGGIPTAPCRGKAEAHLIKKIPGSNEKYPNLVLTGPVQQVSRAIRLKHRGAAPAL